MTPTHIRTLFLHPKPTYTITDAAKLLGMSRRDVRGWMDSGELEPVDSSDGRASHGRSSFRSGWSSGPRRPSNRRSERTWPKPSRSCCSSPTSKCASPASKS